MICKNSANSGLSRVTSGRKTHRHHGLIQSRDGTDMEPPAVEKRPATSSCRKAFAGHRVENRADQQLSRLLQGNRDRVVGNAVNVVGRAVERIDDPAVAMVLAGLPAPSSPRKPCSGKAPRIVARIISWLARSASVTRSAAALFANLKAAGPIQQNRPAARAARSETSWKSESCVKWTVPRPGARVRRRL